MRQPDPLTPVLRNNELDSVVSSTTKPTSQEEGEAIAKAFEQAYKQSHPNGPYPSVELKPKAELQREADRLASGGSDVRIQTG